MTPKKRAPTTLAAPLEDVPATQEFGANATLYKPYGQRGHNGIDYRTAEGTPVYSAAAGTVFHADWGRAMPWLTHAAGIAVLIDHGDIYTGYAHLSRVAVAEGQPVAAGELIGYTGNTGNSTGPHLHFEVLENPPKFNNGFHGRITPTITEQEAG